MQRWTIKPRVCVASDKMQDGWCELETFLKVQKQSLANAEYQHACFGNWTMKEYGAARDGVPV